MAYINNTNSTTDATSTSNKTTDNLKNIQNEPLPPLPSGWDRCRAYISTKHRYCRQTISTNFFSDSEAIYCGNHVHLYQHQSLDRIPCPLDRSHSIRASQLQTHLRKCPKRKSQQQEQELFYYRAHINRGGCGDLSDSQCDTPDNIEWAKRLALQVIRVYTRLFLLSLPEDDISYSKLYQGIPTIDMYPTEQAVNTELVSSLKIKVGGARHLHQIGSLLGHVRHHNIKKHSPREVSKHNTDNTVVLEMGAGRGMTGLVIASALVSPPSEVVDLVMIERAGSRAKADTAIRRQQNNSSINISRVKSDLAHISLPLLLAPAKKNVLVIAKHLCGAGTDLALKSLKATPVIGCYFATCCHGLCTWEDYVGRDYLRQTMKYNNDTMSFGQREFDLLKQWSSGTTIPFLTTNKHHLTTDNDEHNNEDISIAEKYRSTVSDDNNYYCNINNIVRELNLKCGVQGLGRASQRLIDYGRCEYMKHDLSFHKHSVIASNIEEPKEGGSVVEMCHYVDSSVTPQNALLKGYCK